MSEAPIEESVADESDINQSKEDRLVLPLLLQLEVKRKTLVSPVFQVEEVIEILPERNWKK